MKKLRYLLEAIVTRLIMGIFHLLGLDRASALGGWLARTIGPRTRAHTTMRRNLAKALPELDETTRQQIATAVWDNLGRTTAEFTFLDHPSIRERMTIEGLEHIDAIRDSEKGAIFFSAHFGNWELAPKLARDHDLSVSLIYRKANNPWVEKIITGKRAKLYNATTPKGKHGARAMMQQLQRGLCIGMLVDQKMNEGIAVPFFGHDAMTAPAIAQLAIKYEAPLLPIHVVRKQGATFHAIVEPPLTYPTTGERSKDVYTIMTQINQTIEGWIREHPEQWFWVHQRWPKEKDV
jgi:KDO2-lipid IV(A) lauroyltransferase